jgi:hypothetical protein
LHFGVPAAGVVAEMDAGLEQLPQGNDGHRHISFPSPVDPPRVVRVAFC